MSAIIGMILAKVRSQLVGSTKRPKSLEWGRRGFWALIDQALFAGTNFLVGVLLARWLEPAAYGSYSTAYSIFLLIGILHSALWTEPMTVYGAGRFRACFSQYRKELLHLHWRFGGILFLAFLLSGSALIIAGNHSFGRSFLGIAIAAPLILYLWFTRKGAYVLLKPWIAAAGGFIYLTFYVGVAVILLRLNCLNEFTSLVSMGVAAMLAADLVGKWMVTNDEVDLPSPKDVIASHWQYGRWSILSGALSWIPGNVYFVVLPIRWGLESAAALRALLNIAMPVLHCISAIGGLLIPTFVQLRSQQRLHYGVKRAILILQLPLLLFVAVLVFYGGGVLHLMYGGQFSEIEPFLGWLIPQSYAATFIATFGAALRAKERPDAVTAIYGLTASLTLIIGLGATWLFGLGGAIATLSSIQVVSAGAFVYRYFRS